MKAKLLDLLYLSLSEQLAEAIQNQFNAAIEVSTIYGSLSQPPQWKDGHVAFASFPLAKTLKLAPPQITAKIAESLKTEGYISEIKVMGPYLNFFLNFEELAKKFLPSVFQGSFFEAELFEAAPKTMVEYSQPNTHKELHVGHMRNLCLGDAVVRMFRYAKVPTVATTYPGDVGTHVAKTLWYLKNKNEEAVPENRKGAWLGKMYSTANNYLEEQRGTDQEQKNREALTAILKELKTEKGEYFELWKETREWSLDLMKEVYQWADVEFDQWFFESQVDKPSLKLVDEYLEKGFFKEDQGAIGIDLDEYKLGFFMVRKSDGNGLYSTKDLELARRKFKDFQIDKNIYVVDKRQALHFKQVFKALELMGFEQAKDCYHLAYEFVELPDGAMSSRKGNIIPLQDLIDQMESKIKSQYLKKYEGDWEESEINSTAHIIANGAIKYGMCRLDPQKKIVFEMDEWLKLDGNSGPYLQYTYARIQSILGKLNYKADTNCDWSQLIEPIEQELLFKLTRFQGVVQQGVEKMSPHGVCNYLFELCQDFNRFYAEVNISQSEPAAQKARLAFIDAFARVLKTGLALIGIDVPRRM